MQKTNLESAWLYHELGRCCLELENYAQAIEYGEKSNNSADLAEDENWKINSSVLIAQAEGDQLNTFGVCLLNVYCVI